MATINIVLSRDNYAAIRTLQDWYCLKAVHIIKINPTKLVTMALENKA